MSRVLGVDLGARRIGLALSDEGRTAATPWRVLERGARPADDHDAIGALAREEGVDTVVVGLPLTMEGEVGTAARRVLSEVEAMRRHAGSAFEVVTQDERMSTVTAEAAMIEAGERRAKRRRDVDRVAAAVILQAWLDTRAGGER